MPRFFLAVAVVLAAVAPARAQQPAASPSSPALDFDYFRTRIQPIFTTKRDGNARCVSCHGFGDNDAPAEAATGERHVE